MLRKTSKTTLSEEIEKLGVAVEDIGSNNDSVIDVMAIVQRLSLNIKHSLILQNQYCQGFLLV